MADGKGPEDKLLTCAEWEAINDQTTIGRERPASPGDTQEYAAWEYEERNMKRDQAEQARIEKDNLKRGSVMRNLDGKAESEAFFASLGEARSRPTKDAPLIALQYLRGRLATANNKGTIHGTCLNVSNGPVSSGITKLSILIHRRGMRGERDVSNAESPKGEFGIGAAAATAPGLLKAILSCLHARGALLRSGVGPVCTARLLRCPEFQLRLRAERRVVSGLSLAASSMQTSTQVSRMRDRNLYIYLDEYIDPNINSATQQLAFLGSGGSFPSPLLNPEP